jgi:hypothetical protein
MAVASDSTKNDTAWLVTRDRIAGDGESRRGHRGQMGELMNITDAPDVAHLPAPDDLVEWMTYVQHRYLECQGETR